MAVLDFIIKNSTFMFDSHFLLNTYILGIFLLMTSLPTKGQEDGTDYVDLGLSSGLLWATRNMGDDTHNRSSSFYAWGETETKEFYSWENYKWKDSTGVFIKYCFDVENVNDDNKSILESADDVAKVQKGSEWRMPTYDETVELLDGCTWKWVSDYRNTGVPGMVGTSKKNGNSIFFPADGYRSVEGQHPHRTCGFYWTASLYENSDVSAYGFYFCKDLMISVFYGLRCHGHSVRAVLDKSKSDGY